MDDTPTTMTDDTLDIRQDDLTHHAVIALLQEHLRDVAGLSPPESVHALGIERLREADITFWTVWQGDALLGCGALKALEEAHGEIKSMRTPAATRRRGAAKAVLGHILREAERRGYRRLSLETGSSDAFAPARALYRAHGFVECGPFAEYVPDRNSVFMTRTF